MSDPYEDIKEGRTIESVLHDLAVERLRRLKSEADVARFTAQLKQYQYHDAVAQESSTSGLQGARQYVAHAIRLLGNTDIVCGVLKPALVWVLKAEEEVSRLTALLAEHAALLRESRREHLTSCAITEWRESMGGGLSPRCICGASAWNARIDVVLGEEKP